MHHSTRAHTLQTERFAWDQSATYVMADLRGNPTPTPDERPTPTPELPATALATPAESFAGTPGSSAAACWPERIGPYRIEGEIGHGGMGVVLRAQDEDFGRTLAVKLLLAKHQDNPDLARRFLDEAHITGQLQHPGIPPVHAVGKLDDGRPYFTMKLVKGRTLAELLTTNEVSAQPHEARVPPKPGPARDDLPRLLGIFAQVCQTIAYAHSRGIIHRDLKPANVMVGAFAEVQVMDWGLAKMVGSEPAASAGLDAGDDSTVYSPRSSLSDSSTQAGSVLGTPAFMAPEQARGLVHMIDERTDVFGLGALLCTILTGKPPYLAEAPAPLGADAAAPKEDVYRQAVEGDTAAALARLQRCGADGELIDLAARCLNAKRDARPRHAGEVATALAAYQAGVEARLRRAELERTASEVKAKEERKRRKLTAALAVSIVATLLVVGGGWYWFQSDRAQRLADEARLIHDRDQQVNIELERVAGLREQAKAGPVDQRRSLAAQALAAAQRADGLLAHGPDDERLRERVRALISALEEEECDRRMLARLEEARLSQTALKNEHFDTGALDAEYAKAFQEYGIDVKKLPVAEAAGRLRGRAIRSELSAALMDWSVAVLNMGKEGSFHLSAVAGATAENPLRDQIWEAAQRDDVDGLTKLAASEQAAQLPPPDLVLLARLLVERGRVAEAITLLRQVQRLHPTDFWIHHQLADLLLLHARPRQAEEAIRHYSVAVAVRPDSPGAFLNLGHAFLFTRQKDDAMAAFQQAIALKPDYAAAHMNLGLTWITKGEPGKAVAACRHAVELNPKSARAHASLGHALYAQGEMDEAIDVYKKGIAIQPALTVAHYGLGNALKRAGRIDEAIAAYRDAVNLKIDFEEAAEVAYNLGELLEEQGQRDDAIAAFQQAAERDPGMWKAHARLGDNLFAKRRFGDAFDAYRRALKLRPNDPSVLNNYGSALQEADKLDEALIMLQKAAALQPDFGQAHYNLGLVFHKKRQLEDAAAAYKKAIRFEPDNAEAHCNLGQVLRDKRLFPEALESMRRGHELGSKKPHWRYPSDRWVADVESLVEKDRKLAALLAGTAKPSDDERIELILFCHLDKECYGAAALLWHDAFVANPKLLDDLKRDNRYNAACAAALAGCGLGEDARTLDERDRALWRQRALDWLRSDLNHYRQLLKEGKAEWIVLASERLRHWREDPDLEGARHPKQLARLSAREGEDWQNLWTDLEKLSQEVQARFRETRFDGELTAKMKSKAQVIKMSAGGAYVIDLESKAFDAFLRVEDADGKLLAEHDDLSASNLNARLVFTPPRDGEYRVVATSFEGRGSGAYTLRLRELR